MFGFGARFVRRRAAFGGCLLLAGVVLAVHPTWAVALGIDVWNVPALEAELRAGAEEAQRLDAEDEYVRRRIELKEMIVRDLVAERVSLAEATDRFVELNALRPRSAEAVRESFPGATDREKTARNVIAYALTRSTPDQQGAISSRLETELRQMLAADPRG